jgi:hypothetical protein
MELRTVMPEHVNNKSSYKIFGSITITFTPDCYDFEFSTLDDFGAPLLHRHIDSRTSKYSTQAKSPVPSPNIVAA